ncbi:MAG TPA: enoyl-CoA hydratase/isomerase family protein [Candidatus Binatia bacterium]|jgi:enoyl-CoA hydratase/carnithine racemase|nr:enoyl-CoA hydratase/isomerase family protein [Candidatus Binatia bacterium]
MGYETFIVERSGPIATVFFNRPEKLNPINEKVMRELLAITQELQEDEDSRIVILTGKGRSFCVGADLNMLSAGADRGKQRQQSDAARLRSAKTGWRIMEEWERLDQITIAAVNGFAVGGGLSLAMACDFRIAATGVRMWIPEVRLGVPYMWGSITRLINLVGMAKAKELVMTCDELTAEEALAVGLVNQVVPLDRLPEVTLAFAHKILNKPPMALRRTKEFFKALNTNRAGDITYADAHLGLATFGSEDMSEAVTAFREKREGKFQDR